MKIKVRIEEHICQAFDVDADTLEEALKIAENSYNDGKFVLDNADVTEKYMMAESGNVSTAWREF